MRFHWVGPAECPEAEDVEEYEDERQPNFKYQQLLLTCDKPLKDVRYVWYQMGQDHKKKATIQWLEVLHFVRGKKIKCINT